jgi:glycosyltransferase involved in cell wall biosynthesis
MSISIVANYYNNPEAVKLFLEGYKQACEQAPGLLELVLVDDHSHEVMGQVIFEAVPDLRVFRIVEDIAWNQGGARNIGAIEARNRVILFMDIDHTISAEEIPALLADASALELGQRVTPPRCRKSQGDEIGEELKPNINCFMIHRQDFFMVGGYDEIFSGHYGQEDKFFFRCCRRKGIVDLPGNFTLTYLTGRSTKVLSRDKSHNNLVLETMMATGSRSPYAFKNPYVQVFPPIEKPNPPEDATEDAAEAGKPD